MIIYFSERNNLNELLLILKFIYYLFKKHRLIINLIALFLFNISFNKEESILKLLDHKLVIDLTHLIHILHLHSQTRFFNLKQQKELFTNYKYHFEKDHQIQIFLKQSIIDQYLPHCEHPNINRNLTIPIFSDLISE
jgi:hypothetical protein